ncbi:Ferric uptake regulation protein [Campylobacter majalis]|uniref:Ferric uptake regulation protein n=1 Tax=Campylobacter majalis TaxID=2790656 RepID=A0ABM8Q4F7_9BACT|nr:Fur family transcriptional regulator [Campylobacter majalis]CAD7287771.1 Ferric uptake regulation protein [Campylobacter majalis]
MQNFENFYKSFSSLSNDLNHKNSYIKERILNILYFSDTHLSANEIQAIFRKNYRENISLPAIYALLNFLDECKLSNVYIDNGVRKYELNLKTHHDHIICEKCRKAISFCDEVIEKRQHEIAYANGFELVGHSMILYGICSECSKN